MTNTGWEREARRLLRELIRLDRKAYRRFAAHLERLAREQRRLA